MWEFFDRLVSIGLPRVRDFRGVSPRGFDGQGNYTLGLKEQIIFPEIDYDKIDVIKGLNISFVTTAKTDDEGRALLTQLGHALPGLARAQATSLRGRNGASLSIREAQSNPEVLDAPPEPLQGVRRARGYYREFELCRICLATLRAEGRNPRRDQGELVMP